jgi:hypothetical protein
MCIGAGEPSSPTNHLRAISVSHPGGGIKDGSCGPGGRGRGRMGAPPLPPAVQNLNMRPKSLTYSSNTLIRTSFLMELFGLRNGKTLLMRDLFAGQGLKNKELT